MSESRKDWGDKDRTVAEQSREYAYVLRVTAADRQLLARHRNALVSATAAFAETYYNYLFDNPDIAAMLYAYESRGGDVGRLARAEMGKLLDGIFEYGREGIDTELLQAGAAHVELGFKPVWVIGSCDLLIDYIRALLDKLDAGKPDREQLDRLITRLLLRATGLMLEGYWAGLQRSGRVELNHVAERLGRVEDMLACLPHLVWSVDTLQNRLLYANYRLHQLYDSHIPLPIPCIDDTRVEDRARFTTAWSDALDGRSTTIEVRMTLAGSEEHWYRVGMYPHTSRGSNVRIVHCLVEDVQAEVSERQQLQQLVTTDSLTGLPSRAVWCDHLEVALATSRRVPGSQVVVVSLDINQFKMYNDTLGRELGDALLRDVANRLSTIVRKSDSLSRLAGDRFAMVLHPVNNAGDACERIITEIHDQFDIPFACGDRQLYVSVTLGICCFPDDGSDVDMLLTNAETAMRRAKRNGLPYQYFDPGSDVRPEEQLRYSGQIRTALTNDEFNLYYQPQLCLRTARFTGVEALLRWDHPIEGVVMPGRIIPVAEQLGMITAITDWVLVTALRQCRQWSFQGLQLPVSVNVSARSFQNPRLYEKITQALDEAGVDGDCLVLEITEATLMRDIDRATNLLGKLSDLGVTIAIDDFGTGYSSLSYLKRLPIDILKIDRSFIADVAFDRQDVAIVRSVIDLGHNLGCKVIAEGVENRMSCDILGELDCDAVQGFHISEPLPDDHFHTLLTTHNSPA